MKLVTHADTKFGYWCVSHDAVQSVAALTRVVPPGHDDSGQREHIQKVLAETLISREQKIVDAAAWAQQVVSDALVRCGAPSGWGIALAILLRGERPSTWTAVCCGTPYLLVKSESGWCRLTQPQSAYEEAVRSGVSSPLSMMSGISSVLATAEEQPERFQVARFDMAMHSTAVVLNDSHWENVLLGELAPRDSSLALERLDALDRNGDSRAPSNPETASYLAILDSP